MSRGMPTSLHANEDEPHVTLPPHPDPVQRAVSVNVTDACVTLNAAKVARYAAERGWRFGLTHAVGTAFDTKTGGVRMRNVMEPTGEFTEKGNPRTKKVGTEERGPVDSIRVTVIPPSGVLYSGHWVDGGWDGGIIYDRGVSLRTVNWGDLEKAIHAEGEKDVCGNDRLF